MATSTPTTIGNFQLLRTLGEGGMGVVYEAEHITMQRRAAIKVLRAELIRDDQAVRRFFNEARATNEIRHPGIVQIYDCGTREDGSPWLIMELLEGETLSRRIARVGPMRSADVIVLGAQTASVLQAAHRAGIIHRDLKPDNLFIVDNQETPSGERVKVLDFGIAKLTSTAGARSLHTQTGTLMGTPLYMSPEQCRGTGKIDARSDIYSFGLILYQMAAGELPFISEGMGELFDMQMNRAPPPLARKVPSVNPALAAAIERTLRKDPGERFQTMGELQRALLAAGGGAAAAGAPPPKLAHPSAPGAANPARSAPAHATPGSNTTLSAGAMEVTSLEVPRHRGARAIGITLALLVAGGGLFAARTLTEARRGATSTSIPSSVPAPAPTPQTTTTTTTTPSAGAVAKAAALVVPNAAPVPPEDTPPRRITIDLRSSPAEARVVDPATGRLVGVTPLHQSLDRQPVPLQLRIEKTGYRSKSLTIPQLDDYRGSIKLERDIEREPAPGRDPDGEEHIIKL